MSFNIIGDIAGQYDELLLLLEQMPKDATVISVGDMIDRGPKSKEVIEFFMKNGLAIRGNHEDMLLCYENRPPAKNMDDLFDDQHDRRHYYYSDFRTKESVKGIWCGSNGGQQTLESFGGTIPTEVTEWLKSLPLFMETEDLFISHAAYNPTLTLEQNCSEEYIGDGILWNRGTPRRMKGKFQVFGHNKYLKEFKDKDGLYAMCIDNNAKREIVGLHWPTMEVFHQSY